MAGEREQVSDLLRKMKTQSYMVDTSRQIWCFPDFKKCADTDQCEDEGESRIDITTTLEHVKSLQEFDSAFPDPLLFSIGIYLSLHKVSASQRNHRRLQTTLSGVRKDPDETPVKIPALAKIKKLYQH